MAHRKKAINTHCPCRSLLTLHHGNQRTLEDCSLHCHEGWYISITCFCPKAYKTDGRGAVSLILTLIVYPLWLIFSCHLRCWLQNTATKASPWLLSQGHNNTKSRESQTSHQGLRWGPGTASPEVLCLLPGGDRHWNLLFLKENQGSKFSVFPVPLQNMPQAHKQAQHPTTLT